MDAAGCRRPYTFTKTTLLSLTGSLTRITQHPDLGVLNTLLLILNDSSGCDIKAGLCLITFGRHLQAFCATELGSLTPVNPKSVYPSFIISQAWEEVSSALMAKRGIIDPRNVRVGCSSRG
jgi:hypothetical protein